MFNIKLKGPWKELVSILNSYDKRLIYVRRRACKDLAEAFLERLKENAPEGEEFNAYIKSLEVVELTHTRGIPAFAIISRRSKVKLGTLMGNEATAKTVAYIYPSQGEVTSPVTELISSVNPWPLDLVPHGLSGDDFMLVHRIVTEGEMKWARQQVLELISENRGEFRRYGIHWGKAVEQDRHSDELESLPDFMSLAIRAEFGINADHQPHWRPAMKWVIANAVKILEKDKLIKGALHDWLFKEHTLVKKSGLPSVSAKDFLKEAGAFQKKVLSM